MRYQALAGFEPLRRALAHRVRLTRGVDASPEQVVITSGAQQAIDLVTRLLVNHQDSVAIEDPGYTPAACLFAASGVRVVPVPVDDNGIIVSQIPPHVRMVYTTPSHQAPTGVVMSMQRRQDLLAFADQHSVAVIEDDYDSEYRHADRPLEPLYRLDQSGRVIYIGTFSKTLSPSLRLGFVVLPESLIEPATTLRSLMDWQPPLSMQTALLRLIVDGHLDRHLRHSRKVYTQRHGMVSQFVETAVTQKLLASAPRSYAGLHLSAFLPPGVREEKVRQEAQTKGLALTSFADCWHGPTTTEGVIIGFGAIATQALPEALAVLSEVLHSCTKS